MHDPNEILSYIDAFGPEKSELMQQCRDVIDAQHKLLSRWRVVGKGLNLGQHSGEIADYDDELASELPRLYRETIEATEFPK
jgi:hypothetical protein